MVLARRPGSEETDTTPGVPGASPESPCPPRRGQANVPSVPSPASRDPLPPGRGFSPLIGSVAAASLALNVLFAVWLWRTHHRQEKRLARLEAAVGSARSLAHTDGPPAPGGKASREDRVAFLLASAGNADDSKRILETVSVPEAVEMARALLTRPAAGDRNAALDAVFQRIAANDPARAVALLDEMQEPTLRNTLAVRITNLWIEQSPDAAARWLNASGETVLVREAFDAQLARAAVRWSAYDPAPATALLADRKTAGEASQAALANVSAEWGRKDPANALAWAQNLPAADPRRFGILQSMLAGWSERDPAGAAVYLQARLYDGGEGGELYFSTVGLIAERWSKTDLNAAAQWAVSLPSRRARRDALRRVAVAWAAADLPGAARWAGSLAADAGRGDAWRAIVTAWPSNDFDGEGAWVSNLPTGPDRDETVAFHAAKIAPADPEKALLWARTINGPEIQTRTIDAILSGWARTDPPAARNWAAANSVNLPLN